MDEKLRKIIVESLVEIYEAENKSAGFKAVVSEGEERKYDYDDYFFKKGLSVMYGKSLPLKSVKYSGVEDISEKDYFYGRKG
jgi:hypothetical protein